MTKEAASRAVSEIAGTTKERSQIDQERSKGVG
jgi:hypothetical protein